jgi:hypothetical protein
MNNKTCACGHRAATADEFAAHVGEMVIPLDDIASDGQPHAEAARSEHGALGPDPAGPRCVCGFAADVTTGLDDHLLAVFTEPATLSADDRMHG